MARMIDAVNPGNIGAEYDGGLAIRISVLANAAAHVFDLEKGNAPASAVVGALDLRTSHGMWSIAYVNEHTLADLISALVNHPTPIRNAADWPTTGVYLWCADPDRHIASGAWQPPVAPLAVQDTYSGGFDLSDVSPHFPVTVAGYMDGPQSEWPAEAWDRFRVMPDDGVTPHPSPNPSPNPPNPAPPHGGNPLLIVHTILVPGRAFVVYDTGRVSAEIDADTVNGLKTAGVPVAAITAAGIEAMANTVTFPLPIT